MGSDVEVGGFVQPVAQAFDVMLAQGASLAQQFVNAVGQGPQLLVVQWFDQIDQLGPQVIEADVAKADVGAEVKIVSVRSHQILRLGASSVQRRKTRALGL